MKADKPQNFLSQVEKLTQPYERYARLYPALIFTVPIIISVFFLCGGFAAIQSYFYGALTGFGGMAFLTGMARNAGMPIQERLVEKWGGWPTTLILRYCDETLPDVTKENCHRYLAGAIGKQAPTKDDELSNPEGADQFYRAGVEYLKKKTRDTKRFPLLFTELCRYGFWRNLRGLKTPGIVLTLFAAAYWIYRADAISINAPYLNLDRLAHLPNEVSVPLFLLALVVACWVFFVNDRAVKNHAYAYARQLVEACDIKVERRRKGVERAASLAEQPNEN